MMFTDTLGRRVHLLSPGLTMYMYISAGDSSHAEDSPDCSRTLIRSLFSHLLKT